MKWLRWVNPWLWYHAFRIGKLQRKIQRLREGNVRLRAEIEGSQGIADVKQCVDERDEIAQIFRDRGAV